jgi:signal transduction histidine kinase
MTGCAPLRRAGPAHAGALGRIAHDLNNLLMTIVGHCDLLERGALEPADAVRSIRAAAESAAVLTDRLARTDSSRAPRA